jgi:hypothetical protein
VQYPASDLAREWSRRRRTYLKKLFPLKMASEDPQYLHTDVFLSHLSFVNILQNSLRVASMGKKKFNARRSRLRREEMAQSELRGDGRKEVTRQNDGPSSEAFDGKSLGWKTNSDELLSERM